MDEEVRRDRIAVIVIGALIISIALAFMVLSNRSFVHIDAIAHVNKARGIWDNSTPGLRQLGSIWLPLQHLLIAPLTLSDTMWTTGLAGSLLSAVCFVGTGWFLFGAACAWMESKTAGWIAFLLFALNPRLIYLFTTPMTEPLTILCASGTVYYLIRWVELGEWKPFAMACLTAFCGTLARYEGWSLAAAAVPVVFIVARRRRVVSTILFAGAAALGPMLWMLYNMLYFEDPLIFAWGRGSARDYAQDYFFRTGNLFPTAGNALASVATYWTDVAYCVNPSVLWLGLAGAVLACILWRHWVWRASLVVLTLTLVPFVFYCYNLYANMIPVLMPGLVEDQAGSIYNVRYGTVMAATVPLLASFAVIWIFQQMERRRLFALSFAGLLFLPSPIPEASYEGPWEQFTENLFYVEGIHNQSYWMPPFIEVAVRLKQDIGEQRDDTGFVLANSRIVHPTVWATAIHMRRFINEMNKERWDASLNFIDRGIRWVITEEGDQLWHAQSRILKRDWDEIAAARTPNTGVVHLYRRRPSGQ